MTGRDLIRTPSVARPGALGKLAVGLVEQIDCVRQAEAREVGLREEAAGGLLESIGAAGEVGIR